VGQERAHERVGAQAVSSERRERLDSAACPRRADLEEAAEAVIRRGDGQSDLDERERPEDIQVAEYEGR
jgi:hypothetical protein